MTREQDTYPTENPGQLHLPLPGVAAQAPNGSRIPRHDRVFVNRNLRLSDIEWIGFDMDYTLAIYRQAAMDSLSVRLTVERMVARGYPRELLSLRFDTRFPIRGLLVDKRSGHILKMNRFKAVWKGYHGLARISDKKLDELYHHRRIRPNTPRYHWIDTLFGLSEVTSYACIVDALEQRGDKVDYAKVFEDVRESIDEAHREGAVYKAVTADLASFMEIDPQLATTLHRFRSAGKRLFLLTNSPAHYTETVMSYLLGGAKPEYPSWQHYFDVAIVAAQKPLWFAKRRPFMVRSGESISELNGKFEKGIVYEGGSLREFEDATGVIGNRVLYVGDHIYGDILRSKKESSWRTAMIIQELDAEIGAHELCSAEAARMREQDESRTRLEDELRFYQGRYKTLGKENSPQAAAERLRIKRALDRVRQELRVLNQEHEALAEIIDRTFHPYWGSLLKEGGELSSFGLQVDTYADLYARRVSCLAHYSPAQFYRSPHDLMPHEL